MDDLSYDPQFRDAASAGSASQGAGDPPLKFSALEQSFFDGIDALPSGLALFDAQDHLILANKTFREMLPSGAALLDSGANFTEMARHNALTFFGVDEAAADAWLKERLAYRESPKGVFDQRLKDGRWFRIQETRTSEGGTITNWADITDLKIQEQVSANYANALNATNRQLEEFAHVASHDLQEPLRKIEVFGSRLTEKCGSQLDETATRYLDRMIDATGRMRGLISDLLEFSKISNQQASFQPIDLSAVLAQVLETLEIRLQETGATVESEALPTVYGDFGQLSRLFQNLISNAVKYVAKDTRPAISITLSESDGAKVEVCIADNGIGFDQSDAEKIFEVFQRLHGRSGGYDGTGIGLASCRKIVDQHGGEIRAVSQPGAGSQFYVLLPVDGGHSLRNTL